MLPRAARNASAQGRPRASSPGAAGAAGGWCAMAQRDAGRVKRLLPGDRCRHCRGPAWLARRPADQALHRRAQRARSCPARIRCIACVPASASASIRACAIVQSRSIWARSYPREAARSSSPMLSPPSVVSDKIQIAPWAGGPKIGSVRRHRRRSGRGVEFPAEAVGYRRGRGQHSLRRVPECADLEKLESEGVANWLKLRIEFRDDQRAIHLYLTGRRPAQTTTSMQAARREWLQ